MMTMHEQPTLASSAIHFVRATAVTWLVAVLVVVIHFVPGLPQWLEADRNAVVAGQVWRVVTGYLTHWSLDHLGWDLLMFVALGCVIESRSRWRMIVLCLTSALAISLGIACWRSDVILCRGLSGIDTALFTYVAMSAWGRAIAAKNRSYGLAAGLLLIGFCGKVLYEWLTGGALFADSATAGFRVVVESHLIGAAVGMCAGLGTSTWRQRVLRSQSWIVG
jgi:rhomboid family GlyGly-CTERM serine protease